MNYDSPQELFDNLCAPFPIDFIEWRIGSTTKDKSKGMALCYVDARAVMDRLDTMCGPAGWQCNYTAGVNGSIICNIGVQMPDGAWVWKADGAGATDVEGEKGALSDAFKRAAVRWGVGRYLYDLKSPWVTLEAKGNTHVITEAERKNLDKVHEEFAETCGWGLRSGIQAYRLLKKTVGVFVTDPVSAQEFKDTNSAEISQLPIAMRRHLFNQLDRIGATQQQAAE